MTSQKITKKEYKFLLLVSLILIIIIAIPFIYGNLIAKPDKFYSGFNFISPADGFVYASYLEQVKQGHFLFDNLYSGELETSLTFNPFWLTAGLFAKLFQLNFSWALFIFKIILIPFFLAVLYKVISYFLPSQKLAQKMACFLYLIFASGLGLFMVRYDQLSASIFKAGKLLPFDLWNQDATIFLTLLGFVHIMASVTLMLLIFYLFYKSIENQRIKPAIIAGLLSLLLFAFHPFYVISIYAVFLIYSIYLAVIKNQTALAALKSYLLVILLSLPAVFYYFYLLATDWQVQIKSLQNILHTPPLHIVAIGYGFVFLLAVLGFIWVFYKKDDNPRLVFIAIWFVSILFIIYIPLNFQRRLIEGFILPVGILSFIILEKIYGYLKIKFGSNLIFKIVFLFFFLLFFCFSSIFAYTDNLSVIHYFRDNDDKNILALFIDKQELDALSWYKDNADNKDIILAAPYTGQYIPAFTGQKVFLGHSVETINYQVKLDQVMGFFSASESQAKIQFLKDRHISYIFYSQAEKKLGRFNPDQADYLELVFQNDKVQIFKVINNE